MKNVKLLTRHVQGKRTTEYAVFFEHDGVFLRLDWELSDDAAEIESHVYSLMAEQAVLDLSDGQLINEIRLRQNEYPANQGKSVQRFLDGGYKEQDASELEKLLVDKLGE